MPLATTEILTAASALAGVVGLIWLGGRLARAGGWMRMPDGGRFLAVEETLPLGGRQRLLLVRCGRRRAVLLTGGTTDLMLGWVEDVP